MGVVGMVWCMGVVGMVWCVVCGYGVVCCGMCVCGVWRGRRVMFLAFEIPCLFFAQLSAGVVKTSYHFLQGKDDLRQDAVMQQVFILVNRLLVREPVTRKRKLSIRTYKVSTLLYSKYLSTFFRHHFSVCLCPSLTLGHPIVPTLGNRGVV